MSTVVTPDFGPAGPIANRFGTDSASMAKAKCYPDAQHRNIDCFFYCPNVLNPAKPHKIAQRFRCIVKSGAYKPRLNHKIMGNKLKCN